MIKLFEIYILIAGGGRFATPYDSAAGVPFRYVVAIFVLFFLIVLYVYYRIQKDKKMVQKESNINNMNLKTTDISIDTNVTDFNYKLNCRTNYNDKILFSVISNDFDKTEKYLKITNTDDFIYIKNQDIINLVFNQFYDFVKSEGFNKIIVDNIPVYIDSENAFRTLFRSLDFTLKRNHKTGDYYEKILINK